MIKQLGTSKQIGFALASIALGAWTFKTVNEISGPAFEPILAACSAASSQTMDEFVQETSYHAFEPAVGLGVFDVLVCLITQFLYELRQTHPAGLITWWGVILAAMPFGVVSVLEAGRAGAKGPIRYPLLVGLLSQLFGISVMVPLVWTPSYIYGRGQGGVSVTRAWSSVPMMLPALILTALVFTTDTDSYLWTVCAGTLGGPGLAMVPIALWLDQPPALDNATALQRGTQAAVQAYRIGLPIATTIYWGLVYVAYTTYGTNLVTLWDAVWTNANASVAFMTIDSLILFVAVVVYIAYRSVTAAVQALILSPVLGPGGACCWVMAQLEESQAPPSPTVKSGNNDKKGD